MPSAKKQKKIETLAKIKADLEKAQATYFVDYRGLTVSQIFDLREKLKEVGAKMQVVKNTLLKKALAKTMSNKSHAIGQLTGPTATVFALDDQIAPLRVLYNFAQATSLPELKVGFLGDEILLKDRLEILSVLPEKNVLLSQMIAQLSAPIFGLVQTLQGNVSNLVFTLEQIKLKRAASPVADAETSLTRSEGFPRTGSSQEPEV